MTDKARLVLTPTMYRLAKESGEYNMADFIEQAEIPRFGGPYLTSREEHTCGRCWTTWITERGERQDACPKCSAQRTTE